MLCSYIHVHVCYVGRPISITVRLLIHFVSQPVQSTQMTSYIVEDESEKKQTTRDKTDQKTRTGLSKIVQELTVRVSQTI